MLSHPCILGYPQTTGDKIKSGRLTHAFSGAQKRAKMLCHPRILRDPQTKGDKIKRGYLTPAILGANKRAEMLPHLCVLGYPQTKRDKIRSGCLTRAFSGAQKRAKNAMSPLHSRAFPKSGLGTSPLPAQGSRRGRKCYFTPAFSGVPKQRGQNQKWMHWGQGQICGYAAQKNINKTSHKWCACNEKEP